MNVQDELNELYRRFTDIDLVRTVCGGAEAAEAMTQEVDGPFLIKSRMEYEQSPLKLVIIGQENDGWIGPYKEFLETKTLAEAIQLYDDFELERSHNTTFFRYFAEIRNNISPSALPNRREALWLNLFKFNQGMSPQMIESNYREQVLQLQGDVFQKEIALLKPQVVVFLTGPYYDPIIRRFYPGMQIASVEERPTNQLARIVHDQLPDACFRTYHPSYLNRSRGKTADCLPTIYRAVKKSLE